MSSIVRQNDITLGYHLFGCRHGECARVDSLHVSLIYTGFNIVCNMKSILSETRLTRKQAFRRIIVFNVDIPLVL